MAKIGKTFHAFFAAGQNFGWRSASPAAQHQETVRVTSELTLSLSVESSSLLILVS
jgi:hypothetical protein